MSNAQYPICRWSIFSDEGIRATSRESLPNIIFTDIVLEERKRVSKIFEEANIEDYKININNFTQPTEAYCPYGYYGIVAESIWENHIEKLEETMAQLKSVEEKKSSAEQGI